MKSILLTFCCLIALKGFSQKQEAFVEQKSSDWVKVIFTSASAKPKATTTKRNIRSKTPSRKESSQKEFDKTNNEVNRFRKSKKN